MTMGLEILIQKYGYAAILLGTFLEGETVLVLGGFAAHRGYLYLPLVMVCAFLGSFIGDQIYFFIGRSKGLHYMDRRPGLKEKSRKFQRLLNRHHIVIILLFRFLYGLRTVAPFAIGMSGISVWRFFLLNAISALMWAGSIGAAGYFFGNTLELLLEDVKKYEEIIIITGILLILIRFLHILWKNRRKPQG